MNEFLTVDEVAKICKVKIGKAYEIMREVNAEMKKNGFLVIRGRVNSYFLFERLGISQNKKEMIS